MAGIVIVNGVSVKSAPVYKERQKLLHEFFSHHYAHSTIRLFDNVYIHIPSVARSLNSSGRKLCN